MPKLSRTKLGSTCHLECSLKCIVVQYIYQNQTIRLSQVNCKTQHSILTYTLCKHSFHFTTHYTDVTSLHLFSGWYAVDFWPNRPQTF